MAMRRIVSIGRRKALAPDCVIRMPCGCVVTFSGAAGLRSSKMASCPDHDRPEQLAERTEIVKRAMLRRNFLVGLPDAGTVK